MALPERIVDLIQNAANAAIGTVTEEDAKRIEGMAQHPRHAEQPDAAPAINTGVRRHGAHPVAQPALTSGPMVTLMEAHQIEAADGEKAQPIEACQIIQIQQDGEDPVPKPVAHGVKSLVRDDTWIKRCPD
jgi:hypothetical protein